jgi:carbamoyltransferase
MGDILNTPYILGIWDGHDAGAALLEGERILFAINEERLSRRKLEAGFPHRSIAACLGEAGLSPSHIAEIAVSTTDPAKTLTRIFPSLKEEYYLIRRRKKEPSRLDGFKKWFKYRFTELEPNAFSRLLSRIRLNRDLQALGFERFKMSLVDHHAAHAHTAARCSGFDECIVLTLDGLGDGLSGSIRRFANRELHPLKMLPARVSLGIFFEHVTNLMNMRELEDEGKVMALANYSYPVEDCDNPLMGLIEARGLDLVSDYSSTGLYREMKKIFWRYPSEQFAYMAQRVLEKNVLDLVKEIIAFTGIGKLALAGGVFSNVKLSMKLAEQEGVERIFVFPHMGDGGLALGAAMAVNARKYGIHAYPVKDLYWGPRYSSEEVLASLRASGFSYRRMEDVPGAAARFILDGEIILWFRGRMEIGPRALGNRSILARPDDRRVKDRLNLLLKKRVWYQPFCPSMLIEDGPEVLYADAKNIEDNRFMTMAFKIREEWLDLMEGVMNIDGTCRPQFVGDENPVYRELLVRIKESLGRGVVLNTSFNIHGEPVVCSPRDALDMLRRTGIRYLFVEDYLVENRLAGS